MSETPLRQLMISGEATEVGAANLPAFLASQLAALLITGDPAQRPEAEDLAVVGRELKRMSGGALNLGIVSRADEDAVMKQLSVNVVPTVVFVKGGRVVSSVPKLQDWSVYARAAATLFPRAETTR
jgi:hydrogenase-1 operon protein HyaE